MIQLFNLREHFRSFREVASLSLLVIPVGVLSGSASAFFLWALDRATETRIEHGWLLWLLPLGGIVISLFYHWFGKSAAGGNNLILEQIHAPGGGVPARMAPLVLFGTVLTHLFGGSAGREGTAVQMGGSLADAYRRVFRISAEHQRLLLMAGVAAGFGSVFGTPVTGAVFAMEVLVIGRIQYEALIPVLIASVVADWTCGEWGIHHTSYHIAIDGGERLNPYLLLWAGLGGIAFGLASRLFSELVHNLEGVWKKFISVFWLRPVVGALVVIALVYAVGTRDYLGLGVTNPDPNAVTVLSSFHAGGATPWSWWWKLLFTAVTLSCGFKGGEVTPLFFIGAALGNAVGTLAEVPIDLMAGLGFIAVFAGAANTPLACTLMGVELFGSHYAPHFALACFVAYYFSGHSGIYASQIIGVPKRGAGASLPPDVSLREAKAFLSQQTGAQLWSPFSNSELPNSMQDDHEIVTREMGKIRIYLTPRDQTPTTGFWSKINSRPLYRAVINAAKKDGLQNAAAYMTHYGFNQGGKVHVEGAETSNPNLTVCIELIDHKDVLEAFCKRHAVLLKGRTIVYKHVEHWSLEQRELIESDASPNEVIDGDKAPLESNV